MTARDLRAPQGLVALIGAALGLSAAASGMFDTAVWRPVALGAFALTLGLVIAARARPSLPAFGALGGLVVVWAWAWLSVGWAESTSRAETMAGRWGLHVAILAALVLALRDARSRRIGLAALALPAAGVAAWVLLRMVAGSGPDLFVGGQLTSPLGYSNADATYFLLAAWPMVAAAESRRLAVSSLAVAGLTALVALVGLTQARGAVVALVAAAVAIVALVPGRARRIWVLVAAGAGVAVLALGLDVLAPDITAATGLPSKGTLRDAALAIASVSVGVGLVWLAVGGAARAIGGRSADAGRTVARVSTVGLVALAVAGLGGLGIASGRIADRLSTEYHDFVDLTPLDASSSTLLGGGPNQYDYWRIALDEFRDAPVKGVGAGNYQRDYFQDRRTNEDVRQPHSLVFQTLAELGLVGVLGLALFAAAALVGLLRTSRRARDAPADRLVAVGAGGAFVAWLVHVAIDWTWLFPSLMGLGLLAAALLLVEPRAIDAPARTTRSEPDGAGDAPRRLAGLRPAHVGVVAAAAVVLGAAALATARQITTQHYRAQARSVLGSDPIRAIERTSRALALHDEDVGTRYLRAAAFARLDYFGAARNELAEALRLEPHSWVTWGLIGDLELRRGHIGPARTAYERARGLNPRDQGLAQAARDPRALAQTLGTNRVQGR
jgi:hypothetical protein